MQHSAKFIEDFPLSLAGTCVLALSNDFSKVLSSRQLEPRDTDHLTAKRRQPSLNVT